MRELLPRTGVARASDQFANAKTYDRLEDALARFRVVPSQDVPLILITALRSLLADWDHSTPYDRSGV